jgi:hypothetical protein
MQSTTSTNTCPPKHICFEPVNQDNYSIALVLFGICIGLLFKLILSKLKTILPLIQLLFPNFLAKHVNASLHEAISLLIDEPSAKVSKILDKPELISFLISAEPKKAEMLVSAADAIAKGVDAKSVIGQLEQAGIPSFIANKLLK